MTDNRTTEQAIAELRKTVRDAFSGESVSMLVEGNEIMQAIDKVETATLCGTLTAEQVRVAMESRFGFDVWVPNERWRAIADELNVATGGMEGDGLPSVEWGRIITGLIAAHYDNDEERFRERAVKAAKMYDERGKYEVAEYITAQYCPSTTFVPM